MKTDTFRGFIPALGVLALFVSAFVVQAGEPAQPDVKPPAPPYELPPLPYALNALEPTISSNTLSFHYGKHHRTYVDTLNKLIADSPWSGLALEKVITESESFTNKAIFNNAAQVWNHTFFWSCMKPGGGGKPGPVLLKRIEASFGSYDAFRKAFVEAAAGQFGSGYAWLVEEGGTLKVVKTANADTPIAHGMKPLLTCDVWEHAYYLDYQNRRKDFVEAFLDRLVNWEFVESQMK